MDLFRVVSYFDQVAHCATHIESLLLQGLFSGSTVDENACSSLDMDFVPFYFYQIFVDVEKGYLVGFPAAADLLFPLKKLNYFGV